MKKSDFVITKMDCPSEEQLVRMKLDNLQQIKYLDFDIPNRKLSVYHGLDPEIIEKTLAELKLNSSLEKTTEVDALPKEDEQS